MILIIMIVQAQTDSIALDLSHTYNINQVDEVSQFYFTTKAGSYMIVELIG